jgi:hypothetical protein
LRALSRPTKLKRLIETAGADSSPYFEALGIVLAHELVRLNAGTLRIKSLAKGGLAAWQQRVVTAYIEEHLAEQISLAALARLVGWSRCPPRPAADNGQIRIDACWGLPRFACYCQLSALHQECEVGYPGRALPSLATITTMRQPAHRMGVRLNPGALIAAGNVGYSPNPGKHLLTASFSRFDPDRTSSSLARSTVDRRPMALSLSFCCEEWNRRLTVQSLAGKESRLPRQSELKRGPLWNVRLGPDPSPVRFDDRMADR